ncbi:hypothetical protein [Streptomyces sp. BE230]|uniref:hypothetical protein n=1 Tax=Streptomyces sp. BE230 TaxID=3002526 RepID=UPI002ED439BA|nr:hypothetical protein [Streptomyces sp. BE230]
MAQQPGTPSFLERLSVLEEQVALLRRTGWERAELPFYPTSLTTLPYTDATTFATTWETILTPRTATLSLGIVAIGDVVGTTNTGGGWQVLAGTDVVMSGSVPPSFSFQFGAAVISLAPYQQLTELKIQIQARRTSGATTGGRFGAGGSIGIAPRYARLL